MGGIIIFITMIILWGITSLLAFMEVAPMMDKIKNEDDKRTIFVIFMLCGPAFAVTTIANAMLDKILPEGWDDDGDDFIKKY